jgi:hypothetical protein
VTISFARHQFPPAIIRHAVWLYVRFTLSYRDVEDLLAERGLDVSYETVRRWVLKFGPLFARELRRRRPRPMLFCGLGNHVTLRGLRGGAEGIRTDVHRGLSEIASYSSLRQSMRAARSRARAFSIATDALASVALFWLRFPAARRSPRLRRIEVERRRRSQQRKVFSRERVKAIPSGLSWAFPLDLLVSSTIVPVPNLFANGQLPAWSAHLHTGQRS